jgi:uncharacterized Zn finger protein
MSDEFYACGECGAQEQFRQVKDNDGFDVQMCTVCGAIDPETFMFASWEREKEE